MNKRNQYVKGAQEVCFLSVIAMIDENELKASEIKIEKWQIYC